MITGAHIIICSKEAEADRAFFREILNFPHVDVGHGWLIFRLPPAELRRGHGQVLCAAIARIWHDQIDAQQDQLAGHRLAFLQRAQARAEELIAALAAFSPTLLALADEVIE
jgi:hypothetical protein